MQRSYIGQFSTMKVLFRDRIGANFGISMSHHL